MKQTLSKILILAILSLSLPVLPARAGDVYGSTYSATLQSAATATGNGTAMDCGGLATVAFSVSGTFVGTVTFEGTVDGLNWASLLAYNVTSGATSATTTTTGSYVVNSAGLSRVRARVSAYTSGSITVAARGTVAHTNSLSFSGGGASLVQAANMSVGTSDAHYLQLQTAGVGRIYLPASGGVDFQDNLLSSVATPLSDYDAANKLYVDSTAAFSGARVYNTADQSVANNTLTTLTYDAERYDVTGYHSTSANTSRLTIPSTGYYSIGACVNWSSSSTGACRYLLLVVNGTTIIASSNQAPLANELISVVNTQYNLSAGDYVEVGVFQDSGGSMTLLKHATYDFGGGVTRTGRAGIEAWISRVGR